MTRRHLDLTGYRVGDERAQGDRRGQRLVVVLVCGSRPD